MNKEKLKERKDQVKNQYIKSMEKSKDLTQGLLISSNYIQELELILEEIEEEK